MVICIKIYKWNVDKKNLLFNLWVNNKKLQIIIAIKLLITFFNLYVNTLSDKEGGKVAHHHK